MQAFVEPLVDGALERRLVENVPLGELPMPALFLQGTADSIIDPSVQQDYVAERCERGTELDYRTYADVDHLPIIAADSAAVADMVEWTRDRFAGAGLTRGCRVSR